MKFSKRKKDSNAFLEMLLNDADLAGYYQSLPEKIKEEINKKSNMINTPEDLYQIVDNLIQIMLDR